MNAPVPVDGVRIRTFCLSCKCPNYGRTSPLSNKSSFLCPGNNDWAIRCYLQSPELFRSSCESKRELHLLLTMLSTCHRLSPERLVSLSSHSSMSARSHVCASLSLWQCASVGSESARSCGNCLRLDMQHTSCIIRLSPYTSFRPSILDIVCE